MSNALPSVHSELTPLTVMPDAKVTPFELNVNPDVEPESTIAPVNVLVQSAVPAVKSKSSCMTIVPEPAQVMLLPAPGPPIVIALALTVAPVPIVTV